MPKFKKKKEPEVIVEFINERVDFTKFVDEVLSWSKTEITENKFMEFEKVKSLAYLRK